MITAEQIETAKRTAYQQALNDIDDYFQSHSITFGMLRLYNKKNIEMLIHAIAKNAEQFQEYGADTELHFNFEGKKITKIC